MGEATTRTIIWAFALVLVNQAAGQYGERGSSQQQQRQQQQVVENPRVERSGSESLNECEGGWCKSQREGPVGTMWFGPRLGRRRRSDGKLPARKIDSMAEPLDGPILDLIAVPAGMQHAGLEDKRQETTFTPRLGRELEASIPMIELARLLYYQLREFEDQQDQQQTPPPPNFPPRLGRNLNVPVLTSAGRLAGLGDLELRQLLQRLDL